MNLEISEETRNLIQSALATSKFSSADELIAAMVKQSQTGQQASNLEAMPEHLDIDQLAKEQGIGPVRDFRDLRADFWPEGESVDDFLKAIHDRRGNNIVRVR